MSENLRLTTLFRLRAGLARRLGLMAAAGLTVLLLVVAALAGGAGLGAAQLWLAIAEGQVLAAALWSLVFVVAVLGALVTAEALLSCVPAPVAIRLVRSQAPEFFAVLDAIAAALGAERADVVWITEDMNVAVLQRPQWLGVMGPLRTHLTLGLPLVHSVSALQLAAALAHEFAHLAGQRAGWCGLSAHLRAWWVRTLERVALGLPFAQRWTEGLLQGYCLHMLRLSRLEEYEADALAARVVGKALLAETLIELSLRGHFLQHDYWPRVLARDHHDAASAPRPYRELGSGMEAGFVRERVALEWLPDEAVDHRWAAHPTLRRRLRALRVLPRLAVDEAPSAALQYFAPILPALARALDHEWHTLARGNGRSMRSED